MVNVKTIEKREKGYSDLERKLKEISLIDYGEAIKKAGGSNKIKHKEYIPAITEKLESELIRSEKPASPYALGLIKESFAGVVKGVTQALNSKGISDFSDVDIFQSYAANIAKGVNQEQNKYKLSDVKDPKNFAKDMIKTYGVNMDIAAVTSESLPMLYEQVQDIYKTQVMVTERKKALEPKNK